VLKITQKNQKNILKIDQDHHGVFLADTSLVMCCTTCEKYAQGSSYVGSE
jgi:hypothetical protein